MVVRLAALTALSHRLATAKPATDWPMPSKPQTGLPVVSGQSEHCCQEPLGEVTSVQVQLTDSWEQRSPDPDKQQDQTSQQTTGRPAANVPQAAATVPQAAASVCALCHHWPAVH